MPGLSVVAGRRLVQRALEDAEVIPVERAVIGAVLLEGTARLPPLLPHEFFLDAHRDLWSCILELESEGSPVDVLLVRARLARRGIVGQDPLLAHCVEDASIAAYLPDYARLVREAARDRMMVQLAAQWVSERLTEQEIRERLDQLPSLLLTTSEYDPALDWSAIVERWRGQRVMTGLRDLDRMAGGLMPGTFIVIGGRTSHGKTAMLVHLSVTFAAAGLDTEIVTLEEPHEAITRRAVANRSGVSIRRLTDGQMIGNEFPRSEEAVRWLQQQPWRVTGVEHLRTSDEDAVVGLVSASTARCVLVDHLQQITTRDESRQYGIERVTKRLQSIALRDGKLLIVGAQLGRAMDDPPRRPRLNDLRDSGAIEQAARSVWLLYWPSRHKPEIDGKLYELGIAKQSDGPSGWLTLRFDAVCGRFLDA